VKPEEQYLIQKFGEEYLHYSKKSKAMDLAKHDHKNQFKDNDLVCYCSYNQNVFAQTIGFGAHTSLNYFCII